MGGRKQKKLPYLAENRFDLFNWKIAEQREVDAFLYLKQNILDIIGVRV